MTAFLLVSFSQRISKVYKIDSPEYTDNKASNKRGRV